MRTDRFLEVAIPLLEFLSGPGSWTTHRLVARRRTSVGPFHSGEADPTSGPPSGNGWLRRPRDPFGLQETALPTRLTRKPTRPPLPAAQLFTSLLPPLLR